MHTRLIQIVVSVALVALPAMGGHGSSPQAASVAGAESSTSTASTSPSVGGCAVFPADNPWNTDISTLPVSPDSNAYISEIDGSGGTLLHPDFGSNPKYGIPYTVVKRATTPERIHFTAYGDESDPGPYPIPPTAPIEGGSSSSGDRHVLVVQKGTCHLYELGRAFWKGDHWNATVGVDWNLATNKLRPLGWTSADAAGLPILAGLVRYDEVAAGAIDHALRFTVALTQRGYILPATHDASSSTDPTRPPMGLRLRLKAGFDLSGFTGESLVVLRALQRYGMIVADNGSNWYISGATDSRWDDNDLNQLKTVPGTAFEVVDTGPILH